MVIDKNTYCDKCGCIREYRLEKERKEVMVKNQTFNVEVLIAYCCECGEQVYPDEIEKQNDLIIFDEYRRLNNLLTSREIKAIREKRKMSQVELSRFIKAGDKNIARYETGTIQDEVFDNLIRMVGDDEMFYAMCHFYKYPNPIKCEIYFDPSLKIDWHSNARLFSLNKKNINSRVKIEDCMYTPEDNGGYKENYGSEVSREKVLLC